jgi:hypothetical protein
MSRPWAVLIGAAIPIVVAGAFVAMSRASDNASTRELPPAPPPIVSARVVCSFANEDAAAAKLQGADGGQSVVVGDRSWWLFGDTLFTADSGKQIEANTIASSDTRDQTGCPELRYHARDGIAVPFIQKDGSLTVWPSGAIANDDGTFDVFTVYIYGSGPWAYWTGEVGLVRVDPTTMRVDVTARSLFDADSGFRSQIIAAQPVDEDEDGRLRIILQAQNGEKLLARVPRAGIHDSDAYEYWDGAAWRDDPNDAAPLWTVTATDDPIAALAAFEGSTHVTWSDAFDAYVAVMNAGHAAIGVRFAEQLEGPWSDVVPWLDCSAIAEPRVPVCYAPALHPQFSRDGSLFVTLTRFGEYDVVAYELTPGAPVHEYRDGDTIAYGFEPPAGDWEDLGVAFHASRTPAEGLAPIYRWRRDDETAFAAESPGDGFTREDPIFYSPLAASDADSPVRLHPVYAWTDGAAQGAAHVLSTLTSGLELYRFERGSIAFYSARWSKSPERRPIDAVWQ